jgi:hypothetical protein
MGLEYDQESMTYRDRKAELEPRLNALFSKEYSQHSDPEPEPEEEFDDEPQEAFEHAWDAEQEAERQERNRKAREYYHANKKKGKTHGNAARKTKGR